MSESQDVCTTFEVAIEKAIKMEEAGFRSYLEAIKKLENQAARAVLQDVAMEELEHKQQLERALVQGYMDTESLDFTVPTMNLDYLLKKDELKPEADARDALAYAIHKEKESVEFYAQLNKGCEGRPMAGVFAKIANEERKHLQSLEDLYEEHFMTEN